jgi:TonB family protein
MEAFMKTLIAAVVVAVIVSVDGTVAAQDALAKAKTLYAAANYEEALKVLESSEGAPRPEVGQYRALCFFALGRTDEAQREVAAVIAADPLFTPDKDEVAPRVVTLFADVRRKMLPSIIRAKFAEGKRLFSEGNRGRARTEFEGILRLLDDPAVASNTDLSDLKIVAAGFADLTAIAPAPPPAEPAPAPTSPTAVKPVTAAPRSTVVIPAATIQQTLPSWQPRDPFVRGREFIGAVRVIIDENGSVVSATIERSIHAEYDRLLLAAARRWLYKPATREGVGIPSEKLVEVHVRTR